MDANGCCYYVFAKSILELWAFQLFKSFYVNSNIWIDVFQVRYEYEKLTITKSFVSENFRFLIISLSIQPITSFVVWLVNVYL